MRHFKSFLFVCVALLFGAISFAQTKGYIISGSISGVENGASVDLLNGNSGQPENSTVIKDGKFTLKGSVDFPDFKLITINKQPRYLQIFLDNSNISIKGRLDSLESADIAGSPSHEDFKKFLGVIKPYENYFVPNGGGDEQGKQKAINELINYVKQNPNSYVAPIALFRSFQLSENNKQLEELFSSLNSKIQESPVGKYIAYQIQESKMNQIGTVLDDFSQDDPSGKPIKLSSFRGKYVLVDFWASWCGPCRQENPNIVNLYNKYKGKNFEVFGVSLDKSKEPWLEAIKKDQLTWPHVSDLKGWANEVAQKFRITSIPQNFLLDPNGVIIAKNLRGEDLAVKLSQILK